MDSDVLILLGMIFAAFCWWFKLQLDDSRKLATDREKAEEQEKIRAERVRQLVNRR